MLKEIKEKEFNRINGMIDSYTTDINDLVKQADKVDEKYRKLAEKEKKDITEALEYYRTLRDELVTRRDSLGLDSAVVDKKTTAKKLKEAEEKEQVTDILFPENNESPEEETKEEPAVEPAEETVEETTEETAEESETESEESSSTSEVEDVWDTVEETTEAPTEKKEEGDEDDGWPDAVEEWN